jgi:hypothetical protein
MNNLPIIDHLFAHANSSSFDDPSEFNWDRQNFNNYDFIIITDDTLNYVDFFKRQNKKVYAWLLESPQVKPHAIDYIKQNYDKFDKIFTHNKELLNLFNNCILQTFGGCWIPKDERKIHDKTKNISFISSRKKSTEGHLLRNKILDYYTVNEKDIDIFGREVNPIENKIEGLKDYKFSIVIENCREDFYFSEKLIDCLQTGTIPIYWGFPSVNKFFDSNGILTFGNITELFFIIEKINNNEIKYEDYSEAINNNFEVSKKYLLADNDIYNLLK